MGITEQLTKRRSALSLRQRLCIVTAVASARGKQGTLDTLIRGSAKYRVSRRFWEEVFIHLSLVLGFPVMLDAFERLHRLVPFRAKKPPRRMKRDGKIVLKKIYGNQTDRLLRNLGALHPEIREWILKDVYGKVFTRTGLSLSEREIITLSVLALQGLDRQFYSHVRGALRTGVSAEQLEEWLRLVMHLSNRTLKRKRMIVGQVVSQWKKL